MQMPSSRNWVSFHHSGIEYHQSHHLYLQFLNQLLWTWKQNPDLTNQLIHQIFYGPLLARSQSHHAPFNFNSQQDAAELLQFVIDDLKGTSVAASDLISNTIRISVSCNQCFCFSAKEKKLDILTIPLSPNINSSFSKFLKPEILESDNKWFCPSCNCLTESTRETSIISSGSILVIQLRRFSTSHSRLINDQQVFNCSPDLDSKVPITVEDKVSFFTKYSLTASINHSGTLDQRHYWAILKD